MRNEFCLKVALPKDDTTADFDPIDPTRHSHDVFEPDENWEAQLVRTSSTASNTAFQGIGVSKQSRVLTLALVLPICYFLACGGPSGVEPVVMRGGPLIGVVTLVAFPLLYSAPLGLLISEMCTAFPDDGGFVIWVTNAFGPFWGFQEGFCSWVSTVLNNALYPGFVLTSLSTVVGEISSPVVEYVVKVAIVVVISLPTLFGAKVVSKASGLFILLVLVPFIIASVCFYSNAKNFSGIAELPSSSLHSNSSVHESAGSVSEVNWKGLITLVFWSYDDIFMVSLFGGQITNPSYTYPRAVFITLLMTVLTYVVPLVGALSVDSISWRDFEEGAMATVAAYAGGSWLRSLLILSAVCSNVGMFVAAIFAQCYLVNGMAEQALVPKVLSKRHYFFETPYLALLVNTVPVLFLLAFKFDLLLQAANCLSSASQILMIAAAIKLRIMNRDMYQFNKFPGGNPVVIASMIVPISIVGYVFVVSLAPIAGAVVGVGVVYGLYQFR